MKILPGMITGKKKLLLVIPLLLLAAAAALPYWAGGRIQRIHDGYLEEFSANGRINLTKTSYNRGWLKSSAENVMEMQINGMMTLKLTSTEEIDHGAVIFKELLRGSVDFKANIESTVTSKLVMGGMPLFDLPIMRYSMVISRDGAMEGTLKAEAFQSPPNMPMQINWGGLNGDFQIKLSPKSIKSTLIFSPLRVGTPAGSFSVKNVKAAADLHQGPADFLIGSQNVSIARIESTSPKGALSIEGIKLSASSSATGDNIDFVLKEQVHKISFNDVDYGPGSFELQLRNFDASTLSNVSQLVSEMRTKRMQGAKIDEEISRKMKGLFADLTKKAPQIELSRLSFVTGDGEINGFLKVIIDGSSVDLAENPAMLMTVLDVDAGITVPGPVLRKVSVAKGRGNAESEIQALVEQNYLVKDGESYKSALTFKQGRLSMNGRPIDNLLPMLMQGAMFGKARKASWSPPARPAPTAAWQAKRPSFNASASETDTGTVEDDIRRPSDKTRGWNERSTAYSAEADIKILENGRSYWVERNEAARRLGSVKDPGAVSALIRALESDPDPFVRREAALSLGKIGDKRAIGALSALDDENEWVVKFASIALDELKAGKRQAHGPWAVNVASYLSMQEAERTSKSLSAAGHNAYITEADMYGKHWYRVRVGFYSSERAAERCAEKLSEEFNMPEIWVVKTARAEARRFSG